MNKPQEKEKLMSRWDFMKLGVTALAGVVVFGVSGCRGDGLEPKPNVPIPRTYNFIGDPKTKVYHRMNCRLAPDKSKGVFFDSPIGAKHSGYRPCLGCKPME